MQTLGYHTQAGQMTLAIADAIVEKRGVTILRFSDGTPTGDGRGHRCCDWVCPQTDSDSEE